MVASRMEEVKILNPWDRGWVVWGYPGSRPFDAPKTSALDLFIRTLSRASRLARSLSSSSSSIGNDENGESFGPTLPPRTSPYADPTAFLELRSYGQAVSVPYAHSCKRYPKDAETLIELATGAAAVAAAVRRGGGVGYSVNICSSSSLASASREVQGSRNRDGTWNCIRFGLGWIWGWTRL
jgi:hypothetical protein